jgi:hypothetical protein
MCDGFSFETTPEGLAKVEKRIFSGGFFGMGGSRHYLPSEDY